MHVGHNLLHNGFPTLVTDKSRPLSSDIESVIFHFSFKCCLLNFYSCFFDIRVYAIYFLMISIWGGLRYFMDFLFSSSWISFSKHAFSSISWISISKHDSFKETSLKYFFFEPPCLAQK